MNMHTFMGTAVAASLLLSAGIAAAQTTAPTNGVTVTSTPNTSAVSSGTGVTMATFTINGDQSGATITALPITVTPSSGASASNLSNCQVYNQNGTALGTAFSPVAGVNTFTFNPAYTVQGGAAPLTVRCDVASGTPSGATFQFTAAAPVFATGLNVTIDTAPSVPRGATNVALANISLDATRSSGIVNLANVPVTVNAGNGASTADLTSCHIENAVSGGVLSNTFSLTQNAQTSFTLGSAFPTVGGTASMLALVCNVAPATPIGGTFAISINPTSFSATNGQNGSAVTVGQVTGTGSNGLPAALSGTVTVSAATSGGTGSTSGTGSGTGTTSGTPSVPNTGMGGFAAGYLAILFAAGAVALFGLKRLARQA